MNQPFTLRDVPNQTRSSVSVVIPCRGGIEMTMLSLTSLLEHSGMAFELILVNDGSTDATAISFEHLAARLNSGHSLVRRVRVLHLPAPLGCAGASDLGVAASSGEVIAWCNNDMLYGPAWLPPLVAIVESHPDVGLVAPWPVRPPFPFRSDPSGEFAAFAPGASAPDDPFLQSSSAPWVFRRDMLEKVGGLFLDPAFNPAYFEDWDLYNRLLSAGFHFGATRRSVIYHYESVTTSRLPAKAQIFYRNRALFLARWPGGGPLPGYLGMTPAQMNLA